MSAASEHSTQESRTERKAPRNLEASTHISQPADRFYYPELDTIRFFLFLGVWSYHALPRDEGTYLVHHIPWFLAFLTTSFIRTGMCTLDVFFILSAFLITELLLRERETQGMADLKIFYIRRLLRIWPLYFFMLILGWALSLFNPNQVLGPSYALAFLLFAGNWIISLRGYPGSGIIGPLWSVSFEEQFYLLWPLVLRKASKRILYVSVVVLLLVGTFARLILLLHHQRGDQIWYNSFVRVDSIAYGILLALILHRRATLRLGLAVRLLLLMTGGFIWIVVSRYCGLDDRTISLTRGLVGYPLMSLGGVAIFLSVLGSSQDGASFMKYSSLVYLGKISYGLYAYHMLGLCLAKYLFKDVAHLGWTFSCLCALPLTFLLAAASFKWLESPFLRLKQKKFTYVPSGPPIENLQSREGLEDKALQPAHEVGTSLHAVES